MRNEPLLNAAGDVVRFLKTRVPLFAYFSDERLGEIVCGSHVASFEANEAIVYHGAEATLLGVVLSGTVSASALGEGGVCQPRGAPGYLDGIQSQD
jgi:signal-transduction protein with cAMP-binding, CBS, and nucleotidyltransferase domain